MDTTPLSVILNYRTCEFTTLSRDGSPQTWPVSPHLLPDGRFLVTTSIGRPQKAVNIRRNAKVSMLFSDPTGSGISSPGAVLIQGDATVDDRAVSDVSSVPELAALVETTFERQPAGALFSSWPGRWLFDFYYLRLLIYVTPRRGRYWPTGDFTDHPQELDLREVRSVG